MDSEYWRLGLPEELGGTTSPRSLIWAYAELVLGANPAVWMLFLRPRLRGHPLRGGHRGPEAHREDRRGQAVGLCTMVLTSRTPARTWARAAPRRSSRRTAPGTSRA